MNVTFTNLNDPFTVQGREGNNNNDDSAMINMDAGFAHGDSRDDDETTRDFYDAKEKELRDKDEDGEAGGNEEEMPTPLPREIDSINDYLRKIGYVPLLSAAEELKVARDVVKKDEKARQRMIESNLRLVVKLARRYLNMGLDFADLIEEGNLGLMIAVEKFDPEKGFRFSTYATWWIRQSIESALMNQSRTIRIPVHVIRTLRKYRKRSQELSKTLKRAPSINEVAGTENSSAKIKRILDMSQDVVSLDAPISSEKEGTTFGDQIEDQQEVNPLDTINNENVKKLLGGLLEKLDTLQQKIIIRRFGLDGADTATLEEVAKELNVSREKARQAQNAALRKLRKILVDQGSINVEEII